MNKKILSVVLCIVLTISLIPVMAFAAAGPDGSITMTPAKTTVEVGETFDVTFTVNA